MHLGNLAALFAIYFIGSWPNEVLATEDKLKQLITHLPTYRMQFKQATELKVPENVKKKIIAATYRRYHTTFAKNFSSKEIEALFKIYTSESGKLYSQAVVRGYKKAAKAAQQTLKGKQ